MKAREIDANDRRDIPYDDEDLMPPPPPGTIDPNSTGIPDNSRKDVIGNDEKPYINDKIYPIQKGDWVSWDSPLGGSYGQVEAVQTDGTVPLEDSNLEMVASGEDPVCIIRIYRNDAGAGWTRTDTTIGLKMSGLHLISELEAPQEMSKMLEETQESYNIDEVIKAKNLKFKNIDGQLRGSVMYSLKEVAPTAEDQIEEYSAEDIIAINAASIPPGSIIREIMAADMEVDRGFEEFETGALSKMAAMYSGKPVLIDHEWSAKSMVGKVLRGKNDNGQLILRSYFPNIESNKWMVDGINSGLYTKVSVGFAATPDQMHCSKCMKSMFATSCSHQPGDVLKDGSTVTLKYKDVMDVFEVSVIPVPMQPKAHIKQLLDGIVQTKSGDVGLAAEVSMETNPGDTITDGKHTIRNSLVMEEPTLKAGENLDGLAPLGVEAVAATNELQPTIAVDPPAAGTLDNPVTEMKAPACDDDNDADDKVKTEKAEIQEDDTEAEKMFGEIRALKSEVEKMFGEIRSLNEKCADIQVKCGDMHTTMKAIPAPAAPSPEGQKAQEELNVKFAEALDAISKKLDLAMSASTEGLKRLLAEENVSKTSPVSATKKTWVYEYFGQKTDNVGGQQ
jgi:hypothetical protein